MESESGPSLHEESYTTASLLLAKVYIDQVRLSQPLTAVSSDPY